jgi:hypothetical protein
MNRLNFYKMIYFNVVKRRFNVVVTIIFIGFLLFNGFTNIDLNSRSFLSTNNLTGISNVAYAQDESGGDCWPVHIVYFEGANMYEQCWPNCNRALYR